jgi:hypothetical protein
VLIPTNKVSKALASIHYMRAGAAQGRLAHLTLAVVVGILQSLVDATPRRIGWTSDRYLSWEDVSF